MSNRMNNVQIDGATERDVFGLGNTGPPGRKSTPSRSPSRRSRSSRSSSRRSTCARATSVASSSTPSRRAARTQLHGSAFHAFRNQAYGADTAAVRGQPFNRSQTGFSLGGPIIKDKLHFFTANEWTTENTPVTGPYADQPASAVQKFPAAGRHPPALPRSTKQLGSKDVGTATGSATRIRSSNLFARVRLSVNDVQRAPCCATTTPHGERQCSAARTRDDRDHAVVRS